MEADEILPDDIRGVLRDVSSLKKCFYETKQTQRELEDTTQLLRQEVARSRESEEKSASNLECITQEVAKLQSSLSDLVDIKQENAALRCQVKEYEMKICELQNNLEKERLSCHQLMQKSRKECEEQAAKNLSYTQAEADSLREQLMAAEEKLRNRTMELQSKLRTSEHTRNEEVKHLNYDFQEKVNKLQSALTATQAENRNIRDRMQFTTATYQKKIQELERCSSLHPALRTPSAAKGNKALPQLQFLASEQPAPEDTSNTKPDQQLQRTSPVKRRRKLFVHKNSID